MKKEQNAGEPHCCWTAPSWYLYTPHPLKWINPIFNLQKSFKYGTRIFYLMSNRLSQLHFPMLLQQEMPSQVNNISLKLAVLEKWDGDILCPSSRGIDTVKLKHCLQKQCPTNQITILEKKQFNLVLNKTHFQVQEWKGKSGAPF